jgi:hypothetical protein
MRNIIKFAVIAQLLWVTVAYSQHNDAEMTSSHKNDHSIHWNHIAVFGGATSKFEKEGTHFTLGLDYIRKFPPDGHWAISVFGEAIFEEHTEWLFGIPVFYLITSNLWVRTGPAIEFLQEEEHHHGESKTETRTEFLWRLGVEYDVMFGVFSISPSFDIDFGRSTTAAVWGFNFGYGF